MFVKTSYMTVKLNLSIEENLVSKVKAYAAKRETSVSKIVESLITKELLSNQKNVKFTQNYAGILSGKLNKNSISKLKLDKLKKYGY